MTVLGGTVLKLLGEQLFAQGLAQENLGDIDVQSISGAVSTGTHGTGIQFGTLSTQVEEELAQFERAVAEIDGVVECMLVSGAHDYRLKIICRDLDDYERLHREHLGRLPRVTTISSSFVLRAVPTRSEADALFN